jgi:predicted ATPase
VFVGGFTLAAAAAFDDLTAHSSPSTLDLVAALADKSLLRAEPVAGGMTRYSMLGTIREFGLEQLAAS